MPSLQRSLGEHLQVRMHHGCQLLESILLESRQSITMPLLISGMYFAKKQMLATKHVSTNFRTNHMTRSKLEVCLLITLTTSWLSHQNRTLWFWKMSCYKQTTTTMGKNPERSYPGRCLTWPILLANTECTTSCWKTPWSPDCLLCQNVPEVYPPAP